MRVLQVNKLYYPHVGGVEQVVRSLSIGLKKNVDVKVLVANTSPRTIFEKIDGIEVVKIFSLGMLRSAPISPTFGLWLRRLQSDIYHFHVPNPSGELGYLLARPPGKMVVTYHSDVVRQKFFLNFYGPLLKKFLSSADLIMATSPNMIENSPYLEPFREKCVSVPLGVSPEQFALTEDVRKRASKIREMHGAPIVLFLGRFIYYKGIEFLIEAMRDVDAVLILAGSGPLESELKVTVEKTGLSSKVEFVGQPDDLELPAYYHACDIFVLPSIVGSEAFGIVQVEAQMCGKPVISTDLPTGVPYVNRDGETGLIVPPRDSASLARAINRLLGDGGLRQKMGSAGRDRALREFTRDRMARTVLDYYGKVIGEKW